jgi:hypothetical protein
METGLNINVRCLIHNLSEIRYNSHFKQFLGTFTKLQKAIIDFVVSVCPSMCLRGTPHLPLDKFS